MNKYNNKEVIYIVSDSRSGSTLLEYILGSQNEMISVGELHRLNSYVNKKGIDSDGFICGCGNELKRCSFWSKILSKFDCKVFPKTMIYRQKKWFDQSVRFEKTHHNQNINVIKNLDKIYEELFSQSKKEYIIDSSKLPNHAFYLSKFSNQKVKFILLKRHLGAISISKWKWREKNKQSNKNIYVILIFSFFYRLRMNMLKKNISNKIFELTYKELVTNSTAIFEQISNQLGVCEINTIPDSMKGNKLHNIGGTPNKFKNRKIVYDSSWKFHFKSNFLFRIISNTLEYIS